MFMVIKNTVGLRVTPEEEMAGLDIEEHGSPGYGPEIMSPGGRI
jgi:Amt family ammonium transporter